MPSSIMEAKASSPQSSVDAAAETPIFQERGADGSEAGVEQEASQEVAYPFDPDQISISSQVIPLSYLIDQIKDGAITAPQIQRGANLWSIVQQSRLMESLMLKIPLPLFYVSVDIEDRWLIVDGLQRISSMRNFIIDENFKLTGLEFLKNECEGLFYKDLPPKYKRRINVTQLQFATINATTPPSVQRTIFKRLNTGGLPLSAQEIRHALYYGNAAQFLEKLSKEPAFIQATDGRINDTRMAARELILRFIAFLIRGTDAYPRNDDMDTFLCETMQFMNAMPDLSSANLKKFFFDLPEHPCCKYSNFADIEKKFITAMERASQLFGSYAFRKSTPAQQYRTPINKALFDIISIILAELSEDEFQTLLRNNEPLWESLDKLFNHTQSFIFQISRDSLKYQSIVSRLETLRATFESYTW